MMLLGIDPGANTGVAQYESGKLVRLDTIRPEHLPMVLAARRPNRVVFEDSRLQTHTWTRGRNAAATAKMARNVGEVDAWCKLIVATCADLGIPAHGISPKHKGAKLDAEQFAAVTGWTAQSNEHTRDAAMVAFPYRRVSGA
jgi:hypothetical protein